MQSTTRRPQWPAHVLAVLAAVLLAGQANHAVADAMAQEKPAAPVSVPASAAVAGPSPTQDFYAWVNRDWLASTVIPADQPAVNNFLDIQLRVSDQLATLLDRVGSKPRPSAQERQVATLYAAYMDMPKRDALGVQPLKAELQSIDAVPEHRALGRMFARLQKIGVQSPLMCAPSTDFAHSDRQIVFVTQAGLTLEQEDYLATDARAAAIRASYRTLLRDLFKLAGEAQPDAQAEAVLALESGLARIQWSKTQNRDMGKVYNPTDLKGLRRQISAWPLSQQLSELGMPTGLPFNVMQPSYVAELNRFVPAQALSSWKAYLKAQVLLSYAKLLSSDFDAAVVNYDKQRGLYKTEQPRARQAVDYLNNNVGMLLGRIYIDNLFDPRIKATVQDIIGRIVEEYRLAIQASPRMTEATKVQALGKLRRMRFKIGYPDKWRDYSGLKVVPGDLVGNHMRIQLHEHRRGVAMVGKPQDLNDWGHPPQVVNAFYQPTSNSFVLLGAILQSPFFSLDASAAEHYGGIGFVIGHEIGHGFDDQGSRFDGQGNLKNWWAAADQAAYDKIKQALIDQANRYEILPGRHLKGELEIGEIMGDVSGAEIALRAYRKIVQAQRLDEQQAYRAFFMQLARTWRAKVRDEFTLLLLDKDVHPPGEFRANGIVKNFDEFHATFRTSPGDRMYLDPQARVKMWP